MSWHRLPTSLLSNPNEPFHNRLRAVAGHAVSKLATLTVGAAYVAPLGDRLRGWRDRKVARPTFEGRVALVAHVFYPDLIGEVLDCHARFPVASGLIITTTQEKRAEIETQVAGVEGARVVTVANRGRDIAPFVSLLDSGELDGFEVVLKLHTKRSLHLLDGDIRRRLLFAQLGGSRRRVATVLALFADRETGIVGWGVCWRRNRLYWMGNRDRVTELAAAMRLPPPAGPAFFEGSMFWCRPAAFDRLRGLRLQASDFEAENGQIDGMLHHAVERVFTVASAASGYGVRDLAGRWLYGHGATLAAPSERGSPRRGTPAMTAMESERHDPRR